MIIPATLSLVALAEAYDQAKNAHAYYVELKGKGDDLEAVEEARYLLLGWGEIWDLFDAIGLPVGEADA